jgi:hypothetical protein
MSQTAPRNDLKAVITNDFRSKSDTFAVHTVVKIPNLDYRACTWNWMMIDDA